MWFSTTTTTTTRTVSLGVIIALLHCYAVATQADETTVPTTEEHLVKTWLGSWAVKLDKTIGRKELDGVG